MEEKLKPEVVMDEKNLPSVTTPATLLDLAVQKGADIDKLEKLMDLKMKWDASEAKKAYVVAMTAFKMNPPKIEKDKKVSYGNTKYHHASLAQVTEKINRALSEHNLSASWSTKQNGEIEVTCRITHDLGHSEETTIKAPADTSGSKNAIQAIGSTITYLQRYSLLCLTGLATEDMDNDGQGDIELLDEKQLITINNLLKGLSGGEGRKVKFLKYMAVEKVEEILSKDFKKAITGLNRAV